MDTDPTGGWEKSWEQNVTPWDLGQPTPVVLHLHQTGDLPKGRALVPGCGSGHDVVAIACPERFVVGLDISDHAVMKAKELSSSFPNESHYTFLKEDFFTWDPTELFDLIIDYTFFCAIVPEWRSAWAHRMNHLLKPDGELITLMFPISDHVGGPPYKVSVSDYEEVLHPLGFKATTIMDNELAIGAGKVCEGESSRPFCSNRLQEMTQLIYAGKREARKVEEACSPVLIVKITHLQDSLRIRDELLKAELEL